MSAQQGIISILETLQKSHWARSREYGRWGKTVTLSFFKNAATISDAWTGTLPCRRRICLKPVTGHLFWEYFFCFSSTMSLWYFRVKFFYLFRKNFYCNSFTRAENCIPNFLCTQSFFGNYWASAMFGGPDFFANLSDWLKIIDPIFITCDDIG